MARKVVVPENKDGKSPVVSKKRRRGLSCLFAFLITCLIIFAIIFGVGWYFGDIYSKEYLGMPLSDTVGVLNELYWTKDKDVVRRPFSDSDLDGFYDEIKQNILLKDDAEVDFDSALKSVLSDFMKQDGNNSAKLLNSDGEDGGEEGGESGSGIMNVLVEMVASAFTRENIDVERLSAYSEEEDNYIFTLRDKELAAFVNNVLEIMLGEIDAQSILGDVAIETTDFNSVVKLKQIYFGAATTTNELGENVISATTANITVWVGLEDIASDVAAAYVTDYGLGWLSGLVKFVVKGILPKNVYATVTVPLQGDAEAQVALNAMGASKRDKTYQIINAIMELTSDDPTTVQQMLAEIGEKVTPYVEMITGDDGMMDAFDQASQGNIKLDLIDLLAKAASGEDNEDPLTKADFMYLLQAVLTSDPDNRLAQLKPYLYEGWYVDGSGRLEYKPADTTGYTAVNYETEFVRQLSDKYSLNVEGDSLNDVLALLGVSLDGSAASPNPMDMLDYVNGERFTESLDREIDDLKLVVTDRMLAAALSGNLGTLGGEGLGNLSAKLDALTFLGNAEKPTHLYALLALEIGISDMLGGAGDNAMLALMKNVLPEKFVISVQVDITRSLAAGDKYDETAFMLNDYDNTVRALEALGKFSQDLNLASASDQIGTMLRDMLGQLYEKLDVELVASDVTGEVVTQGAMLMPDVFTLMTELVLTDSDGNRIVQPDEFKNVLKGLNDRNGFSDTKYVADDYSAFIGELKDKYYFNEIVNEDGDEVKDIAELSAAIGTDFNGDKLRVLPDGEPETGVSYLAYDTRPIAQLKPIMSGDEIALLIDEKLSGEGGAEGFDVLKVTTGNNTLKLLLMVEVGELLPENIGKLLNINELYVTATVDTSRTTGSGDDAAYPVTVTINNMDGDTLSDTIKIINHLGSGSFDIAGQVASFGKILYKQIASLEQSLGGEGIISFTVRGLELIDFYDFLINKSWNDDDGNNPKPSPETVKSAVQGMYERTDAAGFVNPNNYVTPDFIINAGEQMDFGAIPDEDDANVAAARAFMLNFSADMIGLDTSTIPPTTNPKAKNDVEFNAYLDALMIEFTKSREMVRAVQTFAFAADNTSEAALAARAKLNGKLKVNEDDPDVLEAGKDYMAVTFRLKMEKFMVTDSSVSIGFLPEYVYATIVLEKTIEDGKTKFVSLENGVIFNNLSADEYNVLVSLMSLSADADNESQDENKINIVTITGSSVDGLNKLTEKTNALIEFGESTGDGIGTVKYQSN